MPKSLVYFHPVKNNPDTKEVSLWARKILEKLISQNNISLQKEIPLKIHPGQPGNISFIRPDNFNGIIDYLLHKKVKTYFVETGMVNGPRSESDSHRNVALKHGFTRIPFVVADGENGEDHELVGINGNHFKKCMIAKKLIKPKQIIVLSHFKGHIDAGFGAAIKMLGIGFASRRGKIEIHSKVYSKKIKSIDWTAEDKQYHGTAFRERMADYALAAVKGKQNIYLNFALSIVENCDCDGVPMKPIYKDLGIFASLDPIAIDKACFDLLEKREGKKPFSGDDVFTYAEKIGLGSINYELINC